MNQAQLSQQRRSRRPMPAAPEDITSLNVALFPYLPNVLQFQTVLQSAWSTRYPGVALNFQKFDCYSADPPPDLDVFVFDSIFLSYFVSENYVLPLSLSQIDEPFDFIGYTLAASKIGSTPYGIPYLGCVSVLFSRMGDTALDQQLSLAGIAEVIGNSPNPQNPQPLTNQGLLIDFTGGTTDCCLYLQTEMEINDSYPIDPPLPSASNLDPAAINNLQTLVRMAGLAQAQYQDPSSDRINWFSQGLGRAYVGVTESLSAFSPQMVPNLNLRVLPLADQRIAQPFYVDLVGIGAQIDPARVPLAIELANLMAGYDVMYSSIAPSQPDANPQYLIPARGSVFGALLDVAEKYQQIGDIVLFHVDYPFRIGVQSRAWLNENKSAIRAAILNLPGAAALLEARFDDTPLAWEDLSLPVNLFRRK